jgi:formylglycine-generating enzyme required for sulfatase activity
MLMQGCAAKKPTQIVLSISTDFEVPRELDSMTIVVTPEPTPALDRSYPPPGSGDKPATLALTAGPDKSQSVKIKVTGLKSDKAIVEREIIISFREGHQLLLRIALRRSCAIALRPCPGETCVDGECGGIGVPSQTLPEYSQEEAFRGLDCGVSDVVTRGEAGRDVARTEGGPVHPPDARTDAVVPGVWIPIKGGTYGQGSSVNEYCREGNEPAVRSVTLTHGFEMSGTETTQLEFEAVMKYNPAQPPRDPSHPVNFVSWHEAVAYCNALSGMKNLAPCFTCEEGYHETVTCTQASAFSGAKIYECLGFRLPTSAEWEYAYRAGNPAAYYNGYVGNKDSCKECTTQDNEVDAIGWYCANSGASVHPVRQKVGNKSGLFDMTGNVSEWCHDIDPLGVPQPDDAKNPWGAPAGNVRIYRNGSYADEPFQLRAAAFRNNSPADYRDRTLGFRCVRTLPP